MPKNGLRHKIRRSIFGSAFFCATFIGMPSLAQEIRPDTLSETYSDWVVTCGTAVQQSGALGERLCEMTQELRQQEGGQRVLSVALRPEEDAAFLTLIARLEGPYNWI
jgi:invasion protein IalB